jgi:hypothetical protein
MSQNGACGAPCADIGLWRTATIDTKHREGAPVRLFGGELRLSYAVFLAPSSFSIFMIFSWILENHPYLCGVLMC